MFSEVNIKMEVFHVIACAVLVANVIYELIAVIRNCKYQKLWDTAKSNRIRIDPAITMAELCELYVMFCNEHDCKVEF